MANPDYVPRADPPDGASGAKIARSTASSGSTSRCGDRATGVESGEVDVWENAQRLRRAAAAQHRLYHQRFARIRWHHAIQLAAAAVRQREDAASRAVGG